MEKQNGSYLIDSRNFSNLVNGFVWEQHKETMHDRMQISQDRNRGIPKLKTDTNPSLVPMEKSGSLDHKTNNE